MPSEHFARVVSALNSNLTQNHYYFTIPISDLVQVSEVRVIGGFGQCERGARNHIQNSGYLDSKNLVQCGMIRKTILTC